MVLTLDALHTTKKTARLITGPLPVDPQGESAPAYLAAQALLRGTDTGFAESTANDYDRGRGWIGANAVPSAGPTSSRWPSCTTYTKLCRVRASNSAHCSSLQVCG
jgi:hypothetical protein